MGRSRGVPKNNYRLALDTSQASALRELILASVLATRKRWQPIWRLWCLPAVLRSTGLSPAL